MTFLKKISIYMFFIVENVLNFKLKTKKMALNLKEIQDRMDAVYRQYKNKALTKNELLLLKDFLDSLTDDLSISDKKNGKSKKGGNEFNEKQIKMIEALKMNNPLWDVE